MGRPRKYDANRVTTAIRFRPELHAALRAAAEERDVSVNFLVERAVGDFLASLQDPLALAARSDTTERGMR
jgi:predicted HicB family RNase H-like nuclease